MFNDSSDLQLDSKSVSGIYSNVMKRDYLRSDYEGRYVGATSHLIYRENKSKRKNDVGRLPLSLKEIK